MSINNLIDELVQQLQQALPDRKVGRGLTPLTDLNERDLEQGVLQVIYDAEVFNDNEAYQMLNLFVIGKFQIHGSEVTGEDIERAEIDFSEQLKDFCLSTGSHLHIVKIDSSKQVELPTGWFVANCTFGPFSNHVEQSVLGSAGDIDTVYAGLSPDIGEGHEDDYAELEATNGL